MNKKNERHNNSENKTRILIVDGRPAVRQGLTRLINQESDFVVCAEAENADQALGAVEKNQIDLAVVDISMERTDGTLLTEKIKSRCPNLPVLTVSTAEFLKQ